MSQVDIFILKEDLEKVTSLLYDLKLMHLFDSKHSQFSKFDQEDTSDLTSQVLELRSTISSLKEYFTHEEKKSSTDPIPQVRESLKKLEEYDQKLIHYKDQEYRHTILHKLKLSSSHLKNKQLVVGFIPQDNAKYLDGIKAIRKVESKGRIYFATKKSEDLNFAYKEFYLPKGSDSSIQKNISSLIKKIATTKSELKRLANSSFHYLQLKEAKLSKDLDLKHAKDNFIHSDSSVVLTGAVPKKKIKKLKYELGLLLLDKFDIKVEDLEDAPLLTNHAKATGNFFELLRMYSVPSYKELDPTLFLFWIFPLFYGFILGDFGYGLLSLIVFTLVKRKLKALKSFISILQLSSISSMIFGILYGEYFGFEPHILPFEFHRFHDPQTLLLIAVGFGIAHINLGLILGIVNSISKPLKALYDYASWIFLEIGIILLVLGIQFSATVVTALASFIMLSAVYFIYKGHGFIGIIEIPTFFTNMLSYARLMAVGLSSVVIAILINEFTAKFVAMGPIGIVGGIILFTLGHIFNIILGNFESFLHTLRLHYVEFFTKFYTGGGEEFKAFGERKNHS